MTEQQQIASLLYKYLQGSLTETETFVLETWRMQSEANQRFFEVLQNDEQVSQWIAENHPNRLQDFEERIYAKVLHKISYLRVTPIYKRAWFRVAVAASVFFLAGLIYWTNFPKKQADIIEVTNFKPTNDIEAPKFTKATITLADGKIIAVDDLTAISQSSVQLTKTADGNIVYSGNSEESVYNTLTNPKGSKVIDLKLSDGSHVWLNVGSSISYPVAFSGKERKVTITGEAYFEVVHNESIPFKVSKGGTVITVLGTHFNVNAYEDEAFIKVSLLEGSIKVMKDQQESPVMHAGQQAIVTSDIKIRNNIAMDEVMAWRNGIFKFNKTDIQSMMRQAERWYNIQVAYPKGIPPEIFTGEISRDVNLSEFVKILRYSDVRTNISGNVLTINP
ncbi:FecR domain-containing protein [Terrimonas sp.]|uniref:FecR domain-containing protein n=1 Tax=Terrimonas sp. TaxID=1914338 RepID=UPI0014021066|nr:FecR domain-containing protein [Terrimonas sp.]